MKPWRLKKETLRPLRSSGEASWMAKAPLEHAKGGFRRLKECSWTTLGLSWAPLGRLLGVLWVSLGMMFELKCHTQNRNLVFFENRAAAYTGAWILRSRGLQTLVNIRPKRRQGPEKSQEREGKRRPPKVDHSRPKSTSVPTKSSPKSVRKAEGAGPIVLRRSRQN